MSMKKLAIIGASYLQDPLIRRAKEMGLETHVFAWAANDVGEKSADYFYPISIVEKESILEQCRSIGIDGICTIASDLAAVTVGYVAEAMGLTGNPMSAVERSTNKRLMRRAFAEHGDPSVLSIPVDGETDPADLRLSYPVVVKPTDRSGSRGIYKLTEPSGLGEAIRAALGESLEKRALVEEYAEGREYSVEYVSFEGKHCFLAITQKFTTGDPRYIETGHLEPAPIAPALLERIQTVVPHALDSLGLRYGASHSELKIAEDGSIRLIEIGGRMGGDLIGSHLVELSTGVDFLRAVVDVALGREPDLTPRHAPGAAAVRFILEPSDAEALERMKRERPGLLRDWDMRPITGEVRDSGGRFGWFLLAAERAEELLPYLPCGGLTGAGD